MLACCHQVLADELFKLYNTMTSAVIEVQTTLHSCIVAVCLNVEYKRIKLKRYIPVMMMLMNLPYGLEEESHLLSMN